MRWCCCAVAGPCCHCTLDCSAFQCKGLAQPTPWYQARRVNFRSHRCSARTRLNMCRCSPIQPRAKFSEFRQRETSAAIIAPSDINCRIPVPCQCLLHPLPVPSYLSHPFVLASATVTGWLPSVRNPMTGYFMRYLETQSRRTCCSAIDSSVTSFLVHLLGSTSIVASAMDASLQRHQGNGDGRGHRSLEGSQRASGPLAAATATAPDSPPCHAAVWPARPVEGAPRADVKHKAISRQQHRLRRVRAVVLSQLCRAKSGCTRSSSDVA